MHAILLNAGRFTCATCRRTRHQYRHSQKVVGSFSLIMPVQIERGVVVVGR